MKRQVLIVTLGMFALWMFMFGMNLILATHDYKTDCPTEVVEGVCVLRNEAGKIVGAVERVRRPYTEDEIAIARLQFHSITVLQTYICLFIWGVGVVIVALCTK